MCISGTRSIGPSRPHTIRWRRQRAFITEWCRSIHSPTATGDMRVSRPMYIWKDASNMIRSSGRAVSIFKPTMTGARHISLLCVPPTQANSSHCSPLLAYKTDDRVDVFQASPSLRWRRGTPSRLLLGRQARFGRGGRHPIDLGDDAEMAGSAGPDCPTMGHRHIAVA